MSRTSVKFFPIGHYNDNFFFEKLIQLHLLLKCKKEMKTEINSKLLIKNATQLLHISTQPQNITHIPPTTETQITSSSIPQTFPRISYKKTSALKYTTTTGDRTTVLAHQKTQLDEPKNEPTYKIYISISQVLGRIRHQSQNQSKAISIDRQIIHPGQNRYFTTRIHFKRGPN